MLNACDSNGVACSRAGPSCSDAFFGTRGKGAIFRGRSSLGLVSAGGMKRGCTPADRDPLLNGTSFSTMPGTARLRGIACVNTFSTRSG